LFKSDRSEVEFAADSLRHFLLDVIDSSVTKAVLKYHDHITIVEKTVTHDITLTPVTASGEEKG
jgi:hypothetical protein